MSDSDRDKMSNFQQRANVARAAAAASKEADIKAEYLKIASHWDEMARFGKKVKSDSSN